MAATSKISIRNEATLYLPFPFGFTKRLDAIEMLYNVGKPLLPWNSLYKCTHKTGIFPSAFHVQ